MNHIGVRSPKGIARKEFIRNLAGNYLIVNNETGTVSGPSKSTDGFQGPSVGPSVPIQISTNADNGVTWDIPDWFLFSPATLYQTLQDNFPAFQSLLDKAGLILKNNFTYTFTNDNEIYTVFAPTADALNAYRADTLSINDLRKFLLMHFVRGNIIFTDGDKSDGYYETMRTGDNSTPYATVYTRIHIRPGIDHIDFAASNGGTYTSIEESPSTNMMAGRSLTTGPSPYPSVIYNSVIHQIDSVLIYKRLDTQ